ncbi:hypothetical protein J4Q44_G00332030 [Coregonus suidteri]|uniref:FAM124 domain-containing protein n=1 Tax=Coregonus suidteri TaxID=861788 RepID=A0AAN8KYG7_9TELE
MSSTSSELLASRAQEPLMMSMHLLANPGDSLLLQHTLDRLLRWVCPSLRLFHVSERACPLRDYARSRLYLVAGYPSLAVTVFLHEAYGEERILRVLDFLQRPPWQYHHTESCSGRTGGIHITSPANALLRPYLLPSRDFYSLGKGMPVWGVRPVHCGGEMLRVTLYSGYNIFDDAVRLYETLALKQLSPGVRVEACNSAVLQFRVEEMGQLVPLLPNPCMPISATRWQTEDLDGNKILFQVKDPEQPQRPLTGAFPLTCPSVSPRGLLTSVVSTPPPAAHALQPCSQMSPVTQPGNRPRTDPGLDRPALPGGLRSPSTLSVNHPHDSSPLSCAASPARPSLSTSHLLLEEEEDPETNVDTGVPVTMTPRSDMDFTMTTSSRDTAL